MLSDPTRPKLTARRVYVGRLRILSNLQTGERERLIRAWHKQCATRDEIAHRLGISQGAASIEVAKLGLVFRRPRRRRMISMGDFAAVEDRIVARA